MYLKIHDLCEVEMSEVDNNNIFEDDNLVF